MDIWEILGIAPTNDEKEIRRAYARKLKIYRPDTHPEEYQNLREAFESAKQYAVYSVCFDDENTAEDDEYNTVDDTGFLSGSGVLYSEDIPAESGFEPDNTDTQPAEIPAAELPYTQMQLSELARHISDADTGWKQAVSGLWMQVTEQGSLHVIQQFHTDLARTLAQCEGLTESPVEYLSSFLGWRLNEYDSANIIPYSIQQALNDQLRNTEVARAWKQCITERTHRKFNTRMSMKYITGQQKRISLWLHFVPGFIDELTQQYERITRAYPELDDKINPAVRKIISEKTFSFTREEYYICAYWSAMLLFLGKFVGVSSAVVTAAIIIYYVFIHNVMVFTLSKYEKIFTFYLMMDWIVSSVLILLMIVTGTHSMADLGNLARSGGDPHLEYFIFPVVIVIIILLLKKFIPYNCPGIRKPGVIMYMVIACPVRLIKKISPDFFSAAMFLLPSFFYAGLFFDMIKKFAGYIS